MTLRYPVRPMTRYHVDVFEVLCTEDERAAELTGPLFYCRIETYAPGFGRELVADAYGPSPVDAWLKARESQRYLRDMLRFAECERVARLKAAV